MKPLTHEQPASVAHRIKSAIQQRFAAEVAVSDDLPNASALAAMNERSVCRSYREQALDEGLIQLLCASALSAPSKSDLQQASIVRVCAAKKRAAINELIPNSPWIASAPEFLVFCGDHRRLRQLFVSRGCDFPNNHLDAFFNAAVDAGIVLATFVQAAHLVGLGTCPISEIRDHANRITALLELPEWVFPVAGLTLGYPRSLEPFSPRLGLGATVHVDRYDTNRLEADIAEYDARRIREKPYSQQRDPVRFGEAPAYGWSEDKFRQYSEPQRVDFGAFIRARGFKLD